MALMRGYVRRSQRSFAPHSASELHDRAVLSPPTSFPPQPAAMAKAANEKRTTRVLSMGLEKHFSGQPGRRNFPKFFQPCGGRRHNLARTATRNGIQQGSARLDAIEREVNAA
jgi:hypothetical protein